MDDILAVVTDLFFQMRICAAARAAGRRVRFVSSIGGSEPSFRLALVDLDAASDVVEAIGRLKLVSGAPVVAFGPHLDTASRKAARAAGADRVLAKSKFVTELPHMMNDASGDPSAGTGDEQVLSELREYGRRMEELGRILQDPARVSRLYLAPDPHMEEGQVDDPIILDSADLLGFLAVDSLRAKIQRARGGRPPAPSIR